MALTFHLIPHTHWDREWYLTRAAFQARLVPAMGKVLALLDAEPDARFVADGQTILLDDLLAVVPEAAERVGIAVASGRLEVGPWFVLADEIIPSGESMIRNLLEGSHAAKRLGRRMNVCYCPDAFGHPAMLPTVAAGFGITAGVAWRGLAPDERGDTDLRVWRGPDGSTMLLHHLPPSGYEIGACLADDDGSCWEAIRSQLVARAATTHIAVFVGADHHAPPTSLVAIRDRIAAAEAGHRVRISSLGEYFEAVNGKRGSLSAIEGELRWSYGHTWTLQGVHSTRSRLKRHHGAVELRISRRVEPLVALAAAITTVQRTGRARTLQHAWRTLLAGQFHDTIAGTVHDEVAREQEVRLAAAAATAAEVERSAMHAILRHDPDVARSHPAGTAPMLCAWNPVPRRRSGIVFADLTFFRTDVFVGPPDGRAAAHGAPPAAIALRSASGKLVPVQVMSRATATERVDAARHYPRMAEVDLLRIAFAAPMIGGFAFHGLAPVLSHDVPPPRGLEVTSHRLVNPFVTVMVSDLGRVHIEDHRTGEVYDDLFELDDDCDCGDTYTPHIRPDLPVISEATPLSRASSPGPLVGSIEVGWRMPSAGAGDMLCHLRVTLHADSPVVRLTYAIDNCATSHRLRARVPVGAGSHALAGTVFGAESRAPLDLRGHEYPAETPVPTAPAQRFVAAGAAGRGLIVMQPGFMEYEWTARSELLLTMLRSVGELSRGDLPMRPGHAGWPVATPGAEEQGWHAIEMAVAPVEAGELARPDLVERLWEEAFVPIETSFIREFAGDVAVADEVGITLVGDGLVFTALKPAEDGHGVVLRCYNSTDRTVSGCWTLTLAATRATLVRLDESVLATLPVDAAGAIHFDAAPRALVSIRVEVREGG